jgi:hypothetical protein
MGSGASPRAFVRTLSALSTFTTMVGPWESPILALESSATGQRLQMTGVLSTPAFTGPQRALTSAWWRQNLGRSNHTVAISRTSASLSDTDRRTGMRCSEAPGWSILLPCFTAPPDAAGGRRTHAES